MYFRLAVLYYSVVCSNIVLKKTGKSYKIYQIFFISGSGCSKLTTSLVNVSFKFQTLISKIHPYFFIEKKTETLQKLLSFFQQNVYLVIKS